MEMAGQLDQEAGNNGHGKNVNADSETTVSESENQRSEEDGEGARKLVFYSVFEVFIEEAAIDEFFGDGGDDDKREKGEDFVGNSHKPAEDERLGIGGVEREIGEGEGQEVGEDYIYYIGDGGEEEVGPGGESEFFKEIFEGFFVEQKDD